MIACMKKLCAKHAVAVYLGERYVITPSAELQMKPKHHILLFAYENGNIAWELYVTSYWTWVYDVRRVSEDLGHYTYTLKGQARVTAADMDQLAQRITDLKREYFVLYQNCQHIAEELRKYAVGEMTQDQVIDEIKSWKRQDPNQAITMRQIVQEVEKQNLLSAEFAKTAKPYDLLK